MGLSVDRNAGKVGRGLPRRAVRDGPQRFAGRVGRFVSAVAAAADLGGWASATAHQGSGLHDVSPSSR